MRAAIYTRISSEMQVNGYSLDAQLTACQRLAAERGWQVVATYSDTESGRTTARPQFRQMLQDAERGLFDVIIVHKLDRFSRSVTDTLVLLKRLEALGVSLISISEQFDFTTPVGKVLLTMLSAFAQWYLDNLSQETKKGKRARAERGHWNSAIPFGYTITYLKDGGDGMARPDPATAKGVRLAFESYATGQYSDADVARILNAAGYRPQGRGKRALKLWSKDTVRVLLRNRFYIGEVSYHGQWFPGQHEPLVSRELFERCQQVRARRRHKYGCTAPRKSRIYPLSGIAYCARCGTRMRGMSVRGGRRYYRDPAADRGIDCDQRFVIAQDAEDALGEFLSALHLPDDWKEQILHQVERQAGNSRSYEQQRRRITMQLSRLKDLYKMGDINKEEYVTERNQLKAQLAALQPPQLPDLERAAALLNNFGAIWRAASQLERKQIVHTLLDAVYLDSKSGPVVAIRPRAAFAKILQLSQLSRTGATGVKHAGDNIASPGIIVLHPGDSITAIGKKSK